MEVPLKVWIVMGFIGFVICGLTLLAIWYAYSKKWDRIEDENLISDDESTQSTH